MYLKAAIKLDQPEGLKKINVVFSYMGKKLTRRGIFFTKYFYSTEMLHEVLEIFLNLIGDQLEEFLLH